MAQCGGTARIRSGAVETFDYSSLQEAEFAAEKLGYTATKHQGEVGTDYFDAVTQVIQGGRSSVTALSGPTEE